MKVWTLMRAAMALAWCLPLALAGAAQAGTLRDCVYASGTSGEMATHAACASIAAGGVLRLQPGQMDNLMFDDNGLAPVQVGKLFFYVASDGRSAPVAGVNGEAATFHDGLAPSPRLMPGGGYKIGYIDTHLRLAIPARFDGGLDFSDGRAEVCIGCKVSRDGEMAELQGGRWGCIDVHGRAVVPIDQPSPDQLDCTAG